MFLLVCFSVGIVGGILKYVSSPLLIVILEKKKSFVLGGDCAMTARVCVRACVCVCANF